MKICKPYYSAKIQHITQPFGVNPTPYQPNGHIGVDFAFAFAYGTNMVAPEDVIIKRVIDQETFDYEKFPENLSKGFGVLMTSLRDLNVDYLYWHCLSPIPVKEGEIIKQGEFVAKMGNSGFVLVGGKLVPIEIRMSYPYLGTHLHFERRENNQYTNPIPHIDWNIPVKKDSIAWINKFVLAIRRLFKV